MLTAVITPQGEVLLLGGFGARDGKGASGMWGMRDVWASKDGGRTWEQRTAKAPYGRRVYVGLASAGSSTYLFGGQTGLGQLFRSRRDVWATEDGSHWRKVGEMPKGAKPRGAMGLLNDADNSLLMLGGSSEIFPHEDFNDVWRFFPTTPAVMV